MIVEEAVHFPPVSLTRLPLLYPTDVLWWAHRSDREASWASG